MFNLGDGIVLFNLGGWKQVQYDKVDECFFCRLPCLKTTILPSLIGPLKEKLLGQTFRVRLAPTFFLKYSKNTLVSKNTMVLNTLRCLVSARTAIFHTSFYWKITLYQWSFF